MTTTVESKVRSVLAEPRGRRFSRPGAALGRPATRHTLPESWEERRERLLRQMEGNPRVAHMLEHGPVPHWMRVARQQREQAEREARRAREVVEPPTEFTSAPRGRHRAPRRWWNWPAAAVSTAILVGQAVAEAVCEGAAMAEGLLV